MKRSADVALFHTSLQQAACLTLVTLDKIRTIELGNALHLLSTISIFFHTFFHTMYDVSSLFSKDAWCIMLGFFKHRRSVWRNVLTSKIRYLSFFFNKNSALVQANQNSSLQLLWWPLPHTVINWSTMWLQPKKLVKIFEGTFVTSKC